MAIESARSLVPQRIEAVMLPTTNPQARTTGVQADKELAFAGLQPTAPSS
jgi:hypothetical protein